jgi:hypothetical protein
VDLCEDVSRAVKWRNFTIAFYDEEAPPSGGLYFTHDSFRNCFASGGGM